MEKIGYIAVGMLVIGFMSSAFTGGLAPEPEVQMIKQMLQEEYAPIQQQNRSPVPAKSSNCHPSYSGCLKPNASDYDCEGGSGNGPYYTGRVQVYGYDEFGLDRDRDGWGCE